MAETLAPIDVASSGPAPAPAPAAPAVIRPEPGYVAVTNGAGVKLVPEENAARAATAGYRPATEAEFWEAKQGAAGQAVAAADAVARGATFGLSDAAQVGIARAVGGEAQAENVRAHTRLAREAYGKTALAGEVAGALLPAAVGLGGASAAAVGETAGARALARFTTLAPRLMGEGIAQGAGQQLTEDVLGNHDLAAQKYLASGLKNGLLSVVIGGGLAAGGGAIADKLGRRLAGGRVARLAEEVEELSPWDKPYGYSRRAAGGLPPAGGYRTAANAAESSAEAAVAKEANPLARAAEEQAFKGIGSKLRDWQKLGATAEAAEARAQRIGRTLLDEGISTAGASKAVQAERLTTRVRQVGEELGSLRKGLEKAAVRPSAESVRQRIWKEVVLPLENTPFSGPEASAVRGYVAEILEKTEGRATFASFDELHTMRRALDKKLDPKLWSKIPGSAPPAAEELGKIRGILEDEFELAAEKAAAELGDDVAVKYRTAKTLYSDLKTAEKIAGKEAARDAANRAISLTDTIAGVGGFVTLGPQGLAVAAANKAMRTYGNQAAAAILNRASKVEGIANAAAAFDRKLDSAVAAFFGKGKAPAAVATKTSQKVSPEAARALRDAVSNPLALSERVAAHVAASELRGTAPKVTAAMTNTVMRAASWLQTRLPPEPPRRGLVLGPSKPRPLGPKAQREVDNAVRALDADTFVDDLARGKVDRQALEAMKFINPELHEHVVSKLRRYGIENRPDLSRQQEVALSIMTGTPLTPLMRPETIRGFQEAYKHDVPPPHDPSAPGQTEKKPIGSGGPPPGRGRSSRAFATSYDKMEGGDT
jgi:hypothetical protein